MTSLSEQERKAYESYILSSTDEDKHQAIKQLIPGSDRYYHLYFLDLFKSHGSKLSETDLKMFDQFLKKYPGNQFAEEIQTRLKLLKYDDAETEAQRHAILDEIRDKVIQLSYNYQKPAELERHSDSMSNSQVDQSSEDAKSYGEQDELEDIDEEEQLRNCDDDDCFDEVDERRSKPKPSGANRRRGNSDLEMEDQQEYNSDSGRSAKSRSPSGSSKGSQRKLSIDAKQEGISGLPKEKKNKNIFSYDSYFSKASILSKIKNLQKKPQKSSTILSTLPRGLEHEIDFTQLHPSSVYSYAISKGNQISDLVNPSFFESLQKYFQSIKKKDLKTFLINQQLCNSFAINQLDKIASLWPKIKEDKNYMGTYFQKHFNDELSTENQEHWSLEEKRANLERLYAYAKGRDMPKSLQSTLLLDILEIGVKLGIYDEQLFRDYIAIPMADQPRVFKSKREANADSHWNNYLKNVQSTQQQQGQFATSQSDLIKKYLEHFCHIKGSLESFIDDFDKDYLKQIEVKISIYNSDDMTNLKVDLKKYQAIQQEVILRFLESNKELYKVDEEVQIQVEHKNIQTLYAKIFEFNTETYYKKTLSPFNTAVNLDGLVASEEQVYEYKFASNKKFVETYKFPSLNGKVGLFIIELIGNGMSARAIIKKGSLSLIHKVGVAGHIAYILDENRKICKGPKTGLYFQDEYYEADQNKNGQIFIPYGKSTVNSKAILMNNGFAQLCDFERLIERYSFSSWIYVNSESILIGNKANVMIRPTLRVNQRITNVELLQNSKVTLTTNNYIDRIPVTKTFEDLKFKNNQELIIDFQVPPYLSTFTILLESEIFNVTLQKTEKFSESKTFNISTFQNSTQMSDIYLRKEKGDYYIYVLGKNGEPKSNIPVNTILRHTKFILHEKSHHLITDKEGKIKLGHLKSVLVVTASVDSLGLSGTWYLKSSKQQLTYPSEIDTIENETLEFPVVFKNISRKHIAFLKVNQQLVLEDMFDQISFVKQEDKLYNLVQLKNLNAGEYIFRLKDIGKVIQITIHKGDFWENDSFILKRNCLFENNISQKVVKIQSINVEENKEGTSDVRIKLEDFDAHTRVHCIANQFVDKDSNQLHFGMKKVLQEKITKTQFPFAMWKNIYLSNRELGDEFRYVFDRKYAERVVGSSLDKPKLVLRRNLIQTTQIDQAMLKQGGDYKGVEQVYEVQSQMIMSKPKYYQGDRKVDMRNCVPRSKEQYKKERSYDDYGSDGGMEMNFDRFAHEMESNSLQESQHIKEYQNFLKHSPQVVFNLIPNANGDVKFTANLGYYTQLQVYAINPNSSAYASTELEVNQIQKRDLSLVTPLDTNKGFTESRTTLTLLKEGSHFIEDITSTEIQIIDDLNKVKGVLEELGKQRGGYYTIFKEVSLLMKWFKMDFEDKNIQYSKNSCHELNIFIYFKDPEYFQKVVREYLENKMEKTFVDHYLLGNYDQILKYRDIEHNQKLNALEQCFLIDALLKKGLEEEARQVLAFMKLNQQKERIDVRSENKFFDIVLNMNNLKNDQLSKDISLLSESHSHISLGAPKAMAAMAMPMRLNRKTSELAYANHYDSCQDDDDCGDEAFQMECEEEERDYRPRKEEKKKSRKRKQLFDDDDSFNRGQAIKKRKINLEEMDETKEYCETQYFKQINYSESSHRITLNAFYIDYAEYLIERATQMSDGPSSSFISSNFYQSEKSAFAVIALLNLPLVASSHEFQTNEGRGVKIVASDNLILFKKEVKEAAMDIKNDIMVTHRYIKQDGNVVTYDEAGNEIDASQNSGEFLVNTAYVCEVIITNVSPKSKEFTLLYQIPQGSLPLEMTKYMKSIPQTLSPYTTDKVKFHFYFPAEGAYIHFPTNVAIEEKVIARANINSFKTVKNHTILKKETFKDVLIGGIKQDVLDFLKTQNLIKGDRGFSFSTMLWMLKDKAFFLDVIQILRSRLIFDSQVWSFSLLHKADDLAIHEYLQKSRPYKIFNHIGTNFSSKLVSIEAQEAEFKHLDYFPMLNARVHSVGDSIQPWSLNKNFKQTYEQFLKAMIERKALSTADKMNFVYYMNLQDRVTEAIQLFKTIDLKGDSTLQIQYDYMNAYFDFFTGATDGFKIARSIVRKYEEYPIISWRVMFLQMLDQLNEYDGETDENVDMEGTENQTEEYKKQVIKKQAKKEPNLSIEVKSDKQVLTVESSNIKTVTFKFYIIDVEILFSRTPFLKENTEEFSFVKPCHIIEHQFSEQSEQSTNQQNAEITIPEHLKNLNMVIEINGGGKQIFKTYYSSQLKVVVNESFGELKVTDSNNKPLSKIYIKVFAQKKGQSTVNATFFKDGYTDIIGKFEYSQTSGAKVNSVQKFAILIMSDTLGSIIKECNPPKTDEAGSSAAGEEEQQMNQAKFNRIMEKSSKVMKKK